MNKSKVLENIKKLKDSNSSIQEIIEYLIKTGRTSNSLKKLLKGKYDDILESYLEVRKGKTVCKNCFRLNALGTFYCPNPECKAHNESKRNSIIQGNKKRDYQEEKLKARQTISKIPDFFQNAVEKRRQTNLKRYGNPKYNNSEKIKESLTTEAVENAKEKRRKTNLEKYGFNYTFELPEFREKAKQVLIEKYGCENPMQSEQIKEKVRKTNLKKYGYASPMQSDRVKEKSKETCLTRYGVEFSFQNSEVKEKSKKTWSEKYGVINPSQSDLIKEKKIQTCLRKFGVEFASQSLVFKQSFTKTSLRRFGVPYPTQSTEVKEKIRQSCNEKYGVNHPTQAHLKNFKDLNSDFFKANFIDSEGFFEVQKCMEYFNLSYSVVLLYKRKFGIFNANKTDKIKTQTYLFNNIKVENKILNDRKTLNGLELDILLPDFKLAIEFNGLLFHSAGLSEYSVFNKPDFPSDYHLNKTLLCEMEGIKLFHIFEGEDLDLWLSMINDYLGFNEVVNAEETTIKTVDSEKTDNFLSKNHILGSEKSDINLGVYRDNKLLLIMCFNRYCDFYELTRFATAKDSTVSGGFSKVFDYFVREYKPSKILARINRRLNNAEILYRLGFTLKSITNPNPYYFNHKTMILEPASNYSFDKIQSLYNDKIFKYYNVLESESLNMLKNGFRCIHDSGELILEWKPK